MMRTSRLASITLLLSSGVALAQWQVPDNAIPYGRGAGTGFDSAAAAANSILATNGSSVPGLTTTLPTAVQNNITRVGTLVAGGIPTSLITGGAALTRVDDTNVTVTLGGTPASALLAATSITMGWTGQLSLTRGGTGASLVANNGGVVYSDATGLAILNNPGGSGRTVLSQTGAAPIWSTAGYPGSAGTGTILNAQSTNNISATRTAIIGAAGNATGTIGFSGVTSGTVTIQPQSVAGTYNFNLPTSAGTSGHALLSGGGGSTAMSFGILGPAAGGTGSNTTATSTRYLKGDGTNWITSTGAASGTGNCGGGQFVTGLNSDAAPSCGTPAGGGTVTSVTLAAGSGIALSGTNPITTSGTITISESTDLVGEVKWVAFSRVPANHLKADGSTVSRATYASLLAKLIYSGTATFTNGSDDIGWTAHGLQVGDRVKFFTSGSLPTNFTAGTHGAATAGTSYFVVSAGLGVNTFRVSATPNGSTVIAGSAGSGTHTAINAPWGTGDGSTTFTLPNLTGQFMRGVNTGTSGDDANRTLGTSQTDAFQGHMHTYNSGGTAPVSNTTLNVTVSAPSVTNTSNPGSDGVNGTPRTAAETRPVNVAVMPVIRYQ